MSKILNDDIPYRENLNLVLNVVNSNVHTYLGFPVILHVVSSTGKYYRSKKSHWIVFCLQSTNVIGLPKHWNINAK